MRRFFLPLFVALLALATLPRLTWAWNATGHKTVAWIAWQNLTPQVQAKINALLLKHPQFTQYLEDKTAETPDKTNLAIYLTAATWPDLVRAPIGRNRLYHHPAWHYVDYPYIDGPLPAGNIPEQPVIAFQPGAEPANIIQALQNSIDILTNHAAPQDQQAVALAWLLHLVGDIHQPLHAVSRYDARFPDGDKGGNSWIINADDHIDNLHWYWDNLLGKYEAPELIAQIAGKIMKEHPRTEFAAQLPTPANAFDAETFKAWAQESFNEAKNVVYQNGKIPGIPLPADQAGKKGAPKITVPVPPLSKDYINAARALARQKIALAGYRLAYELNQIFAPASATQTSATQPAAPQLQTTQP